jgi:hypothetical protein
MPWGRCCSCRTAYAEAVEPMEVVEVVVVERER